MVVVAMSLGRMWRMVVALVPLVAGPNFILLVDSNVKFPGLVCFAGLGLGVVDCGREGYVTVAADGSIFVIVCGAGIFEGDGDAAASSYRDLVLGVNSTRLDVDER